MAYRYDYGFYRTRERAEMALEEMFATGEVSEGERPEIEKRGGKTRSEAKAKYHYVITCMDWSAVA